MIKELRFVKVLAAIGAVLAASGISMGEFLKPTWLPQLGVIMILLGFAILFILSCYSVTRLACYGRPLTPADLVDGKYCVVPLNEGGIAGSPMFSIRREPAGSKSQPRVLIDGQLYFPSTLDAPVGADIFVTLKTRKTKVKTTLEETTKIKERIIVARWSKEGKEIKTERVISL